MEILLIIKKYLENKLWSTIDSIFLIISSIQNLVIYKKLYKKDLILISAADEDYFKYLKNLVINSSSFNFFTQFVIYDLGLNKDQQNEIKNFNFVEYRKFNFEKYPSFVSKKENAHDNKLGAYSWKAAIIYEVITEFQKPVIWLDSANLINKKFLFTKIALLKLGTFSTYSSGKISDWTHEKVIKKIIKDKKIEKKPMLNGAVIGFDTSNTKAKKILEIWFNSCLSEDLIAPIGSSRENHRHDQSLYSIIKYQNSSHYQPRNSSIFGISIHNWNDRKIFVVESEDKFSNEYRSKWYKNFNSISTTTFKSAEIIIFLDPESFYNFKKRKLKNKKILLFFNELNEIQYTKLEPLIKKFPDIIISVGGKCIKNYSDIKNINLNKSKNNPQELFSKLQKIKFIDIQNINS